MALQPITREAMKGFLQFVAMREQVEQMTDRLGTPIDPGIIETVTYLNLLGIHTTQSCDGHLDHGCFYPWVMAESALSRQFTKQWIEVCKLEEQAKERPSEEDYNRYLAADLALSVQVEQWKREDELFLHLQELTRSYRGEHASFSDQIAVIQMHPGLCRIEPNFSKRAKSVPTPLKERFLARGRAEMGMFTRFLEERYYQQAG